MEPQQSRATSPVPSAVPASPQDDSMTTNNRIGTPSAQMQLIIASVHLKETITKCYHIPNMKILEH
jgi:hypothetical protein